ncbi:MAG: hypothetical protein A2X84_08790 [Desulfuromonadaceae bacterium GWC2_58_13]|nr:MAG: hypothetical protein A2X84_08790 [Desulfuromonadaceae bacterium GWC2_58_13]
MGLLFIQIEIAIGIEIVLAVAVDRLILSNLVAPSTQTAGHRSHAVEFSFTALTLRLPQSFTDNQHILNGWSFHVDPDFDLDLDCPTVWS